MTSMTLPNVATPHLLTPRAIMGKIVTDPSVAKTALYCLTIAFITVVAGASWIITQGGDAAALFLALGTFLSTCVAAAVKLILAKKNGVSSDA